MTREPKCLEQTVDKEKKLKNQKRNLSKQRIVGNKKLCEDAL